MSQAISQDAGRNTRDANSPIKIALYWYTKLFAIWIVLFAAVGYFWYQPFVFLATHKMFGAVADHGLHAAVPDPDAGADLTYFKDIPPLSGLEFIFDLCSGG